jgi:hypothetical protein
MSDDISRDRLKDWALAIVAEVEPDDKFVVEEGFDALLEDWHKAEAQDEGKFAAELGLATATFAGLVVPFLLGLLGDVVKDVVTDQAKKAIGALIDKLLARRASASEAAQLQSAIEASIAKSKFSAGQKKTLSVGFEELLAKLGPAT